MGYTDTPTAVQAQRIRRWSFHVPVDENRNHRDVCTCVGCWDPMRCRSRVHTVRDRACRMGTYPYVPDPHNIKTNAMNDEIDDDGNWMMEGRRVVFGD